MLRVFFDVKEFVENFFKKCILTKTNKLFLGAK